jgi:carbonic anhydrase/acetyltransferase-like protein (isoleucine patch superfamily)
MPQVHDTAYVDQDAVVIGEVIIEENVVILPRAVIRADEGNPIVIGGGSNIQDGVIIHALKGSGVNIGRRCSIAHGAVVHGPCTIEDGSFIGFRAIILGVRLGRGSFIGHGAVISGVEIPEGRYVPAGAVVGAQKEAETLENVPVELMGFMEDVLAVNRELLKGYREMAVKV